MENDKYERGLNIIEENDQKLENIYKLDYINQDLKGNIEYQNWKNTYIKKYGNSYRLFKCSIDKILFITSSENDEYYLFYQSICPQCKNAICYFCSRYDRDSHFTGYCCLKRRIRIMLFKESLKYIKPVNNKDYIKDYEEDFKIFIIPAYNLLHFIKKIHFTFFYNLAIKKAESKKSGFLESYGAHIRRNKNFIFQLFLGVNIAFAIVLSIPFIIINIYFNIFILIISIPFSFYPLKFILGLGYTVPY